MNPEKQHRKLEKLQLKAEECLTREEAQKIIKKADKAHRKLEWSMVRIHQGASSYTKGSQGFLGALFR